MAQVQAQAQAQAQVQAQAINKKTFRFEFSADIMELIERFAIVHQYDERKSYKEHWNNWYNENKEEMEKEIERMNNVGYVGDVKDKMFKAGRYYFRKKNIKKQGTEHQHKQVEQHEQVEQQKQVEEQKQVEQHEQVEQQKHEHQPFRLQIQKKNDSTTNEKPRRNYITMLESTLNSMDIHIKTSLANNTEFKPSDGYKDFCENNVSILRTEIQRMVTDNIMDKNDISDKIKKTYKNRYYMITKK